MTGMQVPVNAESGQIEAIVIRCGCGHPESHAGQVCPTPLKENLGVISFFHRNPLRQLAWELKQKIKTFFRSIHTWQTY